ncbi:MAG: hypothetical protein AAF518_05250, partial [Spirochaetota bacterium]
MIKETTITSPESYNYATFLPEPGGLFCEKIFGKYQIPDPPENISLDNRSQKWGIIQLGKGILHPLTKVEIAKLPVLPPIYRRFNQLSEEEHRSYLVSQREYYLDLEKKGELVNGCLQPTKAMAELGLDDEEYVSNPAKGIVFGKKPFVVGALHCILGHNGLIQFVVHNVFPFLT